MSCPAGFTLTLAGMTQVKVAALAPQGHPELRPFTESGTETEGSPLLSAESGGLTQASPTVHPRPLGECISAPLPRVCLSVPASSLMGAMLSDNIV